MNILLAVIVMAVVLAQGAETPAYLDEPPVLGTVTPGSPAERAGLRRGDRVLTVAGNEVGTWERFAREILSGADRDLRVTFVRDGQTESATLRPDLQGKSEMGIGVLPDVKPIVAALNNGGVAEKAGLKAGDVIVAVNGEPMVQGTQLKEAISRNGGKVTDLTIRRGDEEIHIEVTPQPPGERGLIGILIGEPTKSFKPGPLEALTLSVQKNIEFSGLIFKTLGGLFTGTTSPRQLMGPVAIAQLSGESAAAGWIALFTLMASISLNLGLVNLMPIPILDGGHILIMALEGIARRDFSVQVKEKMLLAGFVLILLLMVTVIYNDLTRISWIERLMPWRN
jgi:regulator of sigma E protease